MYLFHRGFDVLKSIGSFKCIEYPVKITAEGAVKSFLHGRGERRPRRAVPDGHRAAPVRHADGFGLEQEEIVVKILVNYYNLSTCVRVLF